MSLQDVHEHINSRQEENLAAIKRLISQPSVSARDEGVRECAAILVEMLEDIGASAQICETGGEPAVFGELRCGNENAKTILFYGHYDVQPPEPLEAWITPPFEPTIRDGRLYGRGAGDNKGQLVTHLLAIKSYLAVEGKLPVNVKFIFDGEEESGSPNLASFVREHREMLMADVVYSCDGPMHDEVTPAVILGHRGVFDFEIEIQTAEHDNHSGNKGGIIKNAAWEMVHLLETMQAPDGTITIDGFYDEVLPIDETKQALIDRLPYDPQGIAKVFGVQEIPFDKNEFYKRLMFLPTLSINGIVSGYGGPNSKTIIPCRALAKFDVRTVIDQDGEVLIEKIKRHVAKVNPNAVVRYHSQMLPSYTSPDEPVVKAILGAVRESYGVEPVITPMTGGSLPAYVWTKILGIPAVGVPYANPDENNHAPNENIGLEQFFRGIHTSAQVIDAIGKL